MDEFNILIEELRMSGKFMKKAATDLQTGNLTCRELKVICKNFGYKIQITKEP